MMANSRADNSYEVCCCHSPKTSAPQDPFEKAWRAIADGNLPSLEQAIQEMKESEGGAFALLDTCRLIEKSGVTYGMSLLALCGFHGRKNMVELLLKEGAEMNSECVCEMHTGTPILQMMLHCLIQVDYNKLNVNMVKYFKKKGANLSGEITTQHLGLDQKDSGGVNYSMLDLPLLMKNIDCAKVLVEAGVDLINGGSPGGEEFAVVPMFQEYCYHGTNKFITWVLNQYVPHFNKLNKLDIERIIHPIVQSIINMKNNDKSLCLWQSVQRSPAHAILTSHHEETIKRLVQCGNEDFGLDLLAEISCTGKTALHVAAENNDVESVQILLQFWADKKATLTTTDNSGMNPFMLAVEKGHLDVVTAMISKDPDLVTWPVGFGSTMIHWALEDGHHRNTFFQGCQKGNPGTLLTAKDSQGNTVAHLVADSGNTEVFKILWSKEFADALINSEDKTPFHLAVEKGHVNILKMFATYLDGGQEATAPPWYRELMTAWLSKVVPYFLHASSCGSLSAVKYFIENGQDPNVRHNGKTPLLCAAEAGHEKVVTYLLQIKEVRTDLKNQPQKVYSASASPLLMAAQNGHTNCVTHLLENGANVLQRDSEDRNCLMIAIQNHHKATALVILSAEDGQKVMKSSQNLPLLVKQMPELTRIMESSSKHCSCHKSEASGPQDPFEKAWKAIVDGETPILKQAIQEMKVSEVGCSALLNTCRLIEKSGVTYGMSLLALCGFHERKEMMDLLLKEGADMNAECVCEIHTGTPILQMMLHCLTQVDYEKLIRDEVSCDKLSATMLERFILKGANLRGKIAIQHVGLEHSTSGGFDYGMLDLPLSMKRIDCAKVLVNGGIDLISGGTPGGEGFAVVPMFQEYRDHGTNEFIHWAFSEYIPQHPDFDLGKIIQSIIKMKVKDEERWFWQSVQRAPAHAILTSRHKETIECLVQIGRDEFDLDLLAEQSSTGKTALHVAAEANDVESVQILLQLGADMRGSDNSDMSPFMMAIERGHLEVVKAMIKKDPGLVSLPVGSGSTVIHWALEKGHSRSAFFKACFEENPMALLAPDSQGNTIAHLVAASGNTEVFEILWSKELADAVFSNRNLEDKTPLKLAVEKGHVNLLKTLHACVDRGKNPIAPLWHHRLKTEWWSKVVTYILYASSCGSLDIVKYFIDSGQKPNISHNGKTPLLCAAEAGHDEVVAYLLQFTKVQTDLKEQPEVVESASVSPLLMAAQNGHKKCVSLLLQKGSNILQRDLDGRNCLVIAIQKHHQDTARTILSVKNGLKALKTNQTPTPLDLLVTEMPDLVEYVKYKCIAEEGQPTQDQVTEDLTKLKDDVYQELMMNPVENIKAEITKLKKHIKQETVAQDPVREDSIELRKDICNFKQEMMPLYKKSEEELLGRQEVAVQTHAESTSMTAGYLRGLDVTGETSILVTNQAQTFHWIGYGLKLHIPQGTLPAGLEKCQLLIKVGLSGHFKLPKNTSLVSAVYWLDSEPQCKFSQPITVEMQHCAKCTHTSKLSFVHAKCSQVQLPYDFKAVEGGVFSSESPYGCVQLYHFSLVGLVINLILQEVIYCASLYYVKKGVNQREIHFVITKNLELYTKVVQQKYGGAIVGPDLPIEFESDEISLPISLKGTTLEDGWKIFPLNSPVILKKEVDSFKPGQRIPSCQLKAEWTKESKPPQLNYPVTLDGARKPSNYFCINTDWDFTQPDLHYKYNSNLESEPDLSDLMNKIAAKIPSKWKDIGLQLGVDQGVLDGIATISLGDPNHCYINVFTRWKNQNSPTHRYTWSTLVQALKKPAVGEDRLADEIKNELTGNQLK